ncbi:MAG: bifunctional precorrin-2 dehydrogenase/sirohydrochlorin ferrochelatase [Nitrospiraceae bacterium]|nr:bifunctional precorrin-2 dehydrogenase/sirohydrochlorin ferrochelatase [Nitrospiraceae bacterium]
MSLSYFPAFINLNGKKCVVVGGGRVAERKISLLKSSGADITVVSPKLTPGLTTMKRNGAFYHLERTYRKSDVAGAFLVIAATSDNKVNKRVSDDAPYLVNVVDAPWLSNFNVAAAVNKGHLTISVSTSGACPALAASIRDELKDSYNKSVADFLAFMSEFRLKVIDSVKDSKLRHKLLSSAGSVDMLSLLKNKGAEEAINAVLSMYEAAVKESKKKTSRSKKCSR